MPGALSWNSASAASRTQAPERKRTTFYLTVMSAPNRKRCPGTSSSRSRNSNKTGFAAFTVCRLSHKRFVSASFSGSVRSTLENILVPSQKTTQNTPQAPRKSEFSALPMGCQCAYVSVCGGLYGSVWGWASECTWVRVGYPCEYM